MHLNNTLSALSASGWRSGAAMQCWSLAERHGIQLPCLQTSVGNTTSPATLRRLPVRFCWAACFLCVPGSPSCPPPRCAGSLRGATTIACAGKRPAGWSADPQLAGPILTCHRTNPCCPLLLVDYVNTAMERLVKNDVHYRFVIDIQVRLPVCVTDLLCQMTCIVHACGVVQHGAHLGRVCCLTPGDFMQSHAKLHVPTLNCMFLLFVWLTVRASSFSGGGLEQAYSALVFHQLFSYCLLPRTSLGVQPIVTRPTLPKAQRISYTMSMIGLWLLSPPPAFRAL